MEKEYLFGYSDAMEFPLDESIETVTKVESGNYIVSNIETPYAEVYAPEINFYINHSNDSLADKIKNVKTLYDIRLTAYEAAEDFDYTAPVGSKLIIVSDKKEEALVEKFESEGFTAIALHPSQIIDVNGHIGKLIVSGKKGNTKVKVETDQILWFDAPYFAIKQSGVYDPNDIGFEEACKRVKDNCGEFNYKNFIKYDSTICQYHERQTEICGKCAEVCPSVAIVKIDDKKHLGFSDIDCHGCGGCISVCPSGALDYTQMNRDSFSEIASFYADRIPLIIPRKMQLEKLDLALRENVLPFPIEGEKYLHEVHLLTLLQKSGNPIIFYTDFISKGTGDAIDLLNDIFKRKYNKQAIFICENREALLSAFKEAVSIPECKFNMVDEGMMKREIFTYRLAHLVGEDDLGVVKTKEHIHYGNLIINQDTCTLCLSCVGACNVKALTAHAEDNSLRFNPSMCTNCGYCEFVCPEKDCLEVVYDEMALDQNYFKRNIMATDTLFACVECGIEFATTKSIEKIAAMMLPVFGSDEAKKKSLYCCADCKPKVTMQAFMDLKNKRENV
ncbi:ATP-binding protein [Sulfurovum sp. ST-21]|uniref:4Fe-4S binding protein n=1 Tax=Sulfurovum indicum TaxID=2779528 RepID=A0A7M1S1B5_9BACT|nr:4Fe-4S dicluster domain-containing protein [Sulfurovum indicum]QOR61265.1 4Fe-4S binding protein [Sulfurovum indicum]